MTSKNTTFYLVRHEFEVRLIMTPEAMKEVLKVPAGTSLFDREPASN